MGENQAKNINGINIPTSFILMRWLELVPILFIIGLLFGIPLIWIIAGLLMTFSDIMDLTSGELNPTFPIIAAIAGAYFINPWYLGIFWSQFIFHILNTPQALILLVSKKRREDEYYKVMMRNMLNN